VAKQTPNLQVTQLPPDLVKYNAVVQLTLKNNGTASAYPYFRLIVSDPTCGSILVNSGIVTTLTPVGPGGPTTIGAAQLQVYNNSFNTTTVTQCFQGEVQNNFSDPSKIQDAVNKLITTTFTVCLQLCDSSGTAYGSPVCTPLTFFNQQPGNETTIPILIYPHNNGVPTRYPQFVWSRASKPGMDPSQFKYRLEVCENDPSAPPIEKVETQPGQTFYQWSAGDRALEPGKKYWWRAIGLDTNNQPIGGSNDSGWNITKWFEIDGVMIPVTLGDLDSWVQAAAGGDASVKSIIENMKIDHAIDPPSLADDLYNQLKSGTASVVGVEVSTK
jgi:hypothetical protein